MSPSMPSMPEVTSANWLPSAAGDKPWSMLASRCWSKRTLTRIPFTITCTCSASSAANARIAVPLKCNTLQLPGYTLLCSCSLVDHRTTLCAMVDQATTTEHICVPDATSVTQLASSNKGHHQAAHQACMSRSAKGQEARVQESRCHAGKQLGDDLGQKVRQWACVGKLVWVAEFFKS